MEGERSICTVFPPALSGNRWRTFFIAVARCQKMNLVSIQIKSHQSIIWLQVEYVHVISLWLVVSLELIREFVQDSLYSDVPCGFTIQPKKG